MPLVGKLEARIVVLDVAMPLLQGQQVKLSLATSQRKAPDYQLYRWAFAGATTLTRDPSSKRLDDLTGSLDLDLPSILQVTLHAHAARETGHVSRLIAGVDAKTGETSKKRPRVLLKGQGAIIEVTAHRPLCLELYSDCRALGRVVLREGGQTLAVGIVVKVYE